MSKSVIMYTTPTCGYCNMAKEFFKANNIEYTTKDVTQDAAAYQEILDKSGQLGVPVIDIEGDITVGFDKKKLETALGLA